MTNKEIVNRNIGLSFDFIRQIIDNPELLDNVENNSVVDFLQKDYPEREDANSKPANKYFKVKRTFEVI
jgi:hypothetical protein